MVMMGMIMVVAAAGAVLVMLLMVMIVMMAAALAFLVVVVMVMTAAVTFLVIVVMVMAAAVAFFMVMLLMVMLLMVMIVVMAAAGAVLVMVVVMLLLLMQLCQLGSQGGLAFQCGSQLLAGQLAPGGGDDGSLVVVLPEHGHGSIQLGLGNGIGTGQDDGGGGFDLVVVELAEVLHIDLHLTGIHNGHGVANGNFLVGDLVDSTDHIRQLANAGGLDDDPVRMILVDHPGQGLAEVAHQRAADAAGVHLGDVDAGILQKAAVNADLAELVLDQHQLLPLVAFSDHLFDQGRLARAEEAGENINFCHKKHLLYKIL